ncbi:MAG: 50S ribosomal protein L18Ae [Candidatus Hydrothermarchaeales archaeon]
METKIFRISGKFRMGEELQIFTKEFRAVSKESGIEKLYTDLGSKHKVKRNRIIIDKIKEITPEEAENVYVREMSGV